MVLSFFGFMHGFAYCLKHYYVFDGKYSSGILKGVKFSLKESKQMKKEKKNIEK